MGEFRRGQRVRLTSDYPVGDFMLPEFADGIILSAGRGVSEVRFPQGTFLVENEFLEWVEAGFAHIGDEYEFDLERKRRRGEDMMGGSTTGRSIDWEASDLADQSSRGFGQSVYKFMLEQESKGRRN